MGAAGRLVEEFNRSAWSGFIGDAGAVPRRPYNEGSYQSHCTKTREQTGTHPAIRGTTKIISHLILS